MFVNHKKSRTTRPARYVPTLVVITVSSGTRFAFSWFRCAVHDGRTSDETNWKVITRNCTFATTTTTTKDQWRTELGSTRASNYPCHRWQSSLTVPKPNRLNCWLLVSGTLELRHLLSPVQFRAVSTFVVRSEILVAFHLFYLLLFAGSSCADGSR